MIFCLPFTTKMFRNLIFLRKKMCFPTDHRSSIKFQKITHICKHIFVKFCQKFPRVHHKNAAVFTWCRKIKFGKLLANWKICIFSFFQNCAVAFNKLVIDTSASPSKSIRLEISHEVPRVHYVTSPVRKSSSRNFGFWGSKNVKIILLSEVFFFYRFHKTM